MKKYILQDTHMPESITTSFNMRQNAWGKLPNSVDLVKDIGKIHLPYAHTKCQVDMCVNKMDEFLNVAHYIAKNALKLKQNDIGIVEGDCKGVIIQMISEVKYGIIDELMIVRKDRSCTHQYTSQGHDMGPHLGCELCYSSVISVIRSNNLVEIQKANKNGYIIEPFYAPYFDVKVLGEIDYNGKTRMIGTMGAFSKATHFFKETAV